MENTDQKPVTIGTWGDNISWEFCETSTLPPVELCTAVMCVAIADGKIVLACSERGWGMLGGHIEEGETLDAALLREAREEGGFSVDHYQLFAVRKITAKVPAAHQQPGKSYPFPTSYIVYYWATTAQSLEAPTGGEIIEGGSFGLVEAETLGTPDLPVIEAGWNAYKKYEQALFQVVA